MNRSQRKAKRPSVKHLVNRNSKNANSHMDVSFPDDSNDSGLGTELLSQITISRDSLLLDEFDNSSSDDLDKDSSIDSLDSGIYSLSKSEESCSLMETLPSLDIGCNLLEESSLAHLLCQAVSITEDIGLQCPPVVESLDEPPLKKLCLAPKPQQLSETNQNKKLVIKVDHSSIGGKQIDLLGIAPENERPNLSSTKSSSNNMTSSNTCNSTTSRRKTNRKLLPSLHVTYPSHFKDGEIELRILSQPEEQHRARYMTEGSRGAVKDRIGTGFPTVKLFGYHQPVTLQVFIGTDQGKVQPHLFYQACKVSGKNCTPCTERVIDGTAVIEISMLPDKDMTVSCDCIGILKERNVDVEQRLPYFSMTRAKKKNTRCRMVFRVHVPISDVSLETLQVASCPILCTQPPGIPEISKKSLKESSIFGGKELFIIGKNFLKDTKVIFQDGFADNENERSPSWQEIVEPEKEFLHQTHLVCRVPPYCDQTVVEPLKVQLLVQSGGKTSEPHTFIYLPAQQGIPVENSGKLQHMTTGLAGCIDSDNRTYRNVLPAIIQIPGMSSNGTTALVVAQHSNGLITVPGRSSSALTTGNLSQQNTNKMLKHFPKGSKTSHRGIENHQSHVMTMLHEKPNKKITFAAPAALNSLRHRNCNYLGKRISNRYHSKGKHSHGKMLDMRAKFQANRNSLTVNVNNGHNLDNQILLNQPVQVFKEENKKIAEVSMYTDIVPSATTVRNTLDQSQYFPVQVKSQVTDISDVEQQSLFESQVLSPASKKIEDTDVFIGRPVLSEPANSLVDMEQSQLFSPTLVASSHLQVPPIPSDLLSSSSHVEPLSVVANQSLDNPETIISLSSTNDISVQLPHVSSEEMPVLQPTIPSVTVLTNQIPSVSGELMSSRLHEPELLSPTTATQPSVLSLVVSHQALCVDSIADSALCTSLNPANAVQNQCIQTADLIVSPPFSCTLKPHMQQENGDQTPPIQSIGIASSDVIQPTHISTPVSSSSILQSVKSENKSEPDSLGPAVVSLEMPGSLAISCKNETLHTTVSTQSSRRMLLANEQLIKKSGMDTVLTSTHNTSISSDQTVVVSIPQSVISLSMMPTTVTSAASTLCTSESVISSKDSIENQPNSTASQVTPSVPAVIIPITQLSEKSRIIDVKPEKVADQCEMTIFQNCMTTALSQLSEADLIQFINPSTFDNV